MDEMIQVETGSGTVYAPSWEALASLFKKMATVMGSAGAVRETGKNAQDRYTYADANDVLAPVQKAMANANIGHVMQVVGIEQVNEERGNGKAPGLRTTLTANAIFGDGDTGAFIVSTWVSEATDFGMRDKGINKCATTAQKFFMKRAFLLVSKDDIDNDPDGASEPDGKADPIHGSTGKSKDDTTLSLAPLQPLVDHLNEAFGLGLNVAQVYVSVTGDEPTSDFASLKGPVIRLYIAEAIKAVAARTVGDAEYDMAKVQSHIDETVTDKTMGSMKARYAAIRDYFGEKE